MSSAIQFFVWLKWYRFHIALAVVLPALLAKFFWSFFVFHMPLGYDVGVYRYLFLQYAAALPPFQLPDLPDWAREHPLGLFLFSTLFLKLGIPVEWLLGWIWNLVPVLLACTLAWVVSQRRLSQSFGRLGAGVAILTLLAALLSQAFYDGFAAMYWKTYAALFFMVLAFHTLEHKSPWAILWGLLTVITHHQTGLLFGLAFFSWWLASFLTHVSDVPSQEDVLLGQQTLHLNTEEWSPRLSPRQTLIVFGAGVVIFVVGLLWYLPIWEETLLRQVPSIFNLERIAGGNFPEPLFYIRVTGLLLLLGLIGFFWDMKREQWTVWQFAVLWSAAFVVFRLFFYRRFFLQLDFFLLPFVAYGVAALWRQWRILLVRSSLVAVIGVQGALSVQAMTHHGPLLDPDTFIAVTDVESTVPDDATVIALEDQSAMILRGWLPFHHIGGPGLFELFWSEEEWERFLLGTHEERLSFLKRLTGPVFLFVSPQFKAYYKERGELFLADSCFEQTKNRFLYLVVDDCL